MSAQPALRLDQDRAACRRRPLVGLLPARLELEEGKSDQLGGTVVQVRAQGAEEPLVLLEHPLRTLLEAFMERLLARHRLRELVDALGELGSSARSMVLPPP